MSSSTEKATSSWQHRCWRRQAASLRKNSTFLISAVLTSPIKNEKNCHTALSWIFMTRALYSAPVKTRSIRRTFCRLCCSFTPDTRKHRCPQVVIERAVHHSRRIAVTQLPAVSHGGKQVRRPDTSRGFLLSEARFSRLLHTVIHDVKCVRSAGFSLWVQMIDMASATGLHY